MLSRLMIIVIQLKMLTITQEVDEIAKKMTNHDKYFTTLDLNKLTSENFAARLKQAKLATKDDIDVVKETDLMGN